MFKGLADLDTLGSDRQDGPMFRVICLVAIFSSSVFAGAFNLTITKPKAAVYAEPSSQARIVTHVKQGKIFKATGERSNSFYQLASKSGRSLWIHQDDVESDEADLIEARNLLKRRKRNSFKRFSMDFGVSTGSVSGGSFFEANVGLDYYFLYWLSWRNGIFYRVASNQPNFAGWDTSFRANLRESIVHAHTGLGYRVTTQGDHAPFVEAGAILSVPGMALGANVKYLMHSLTSPTGSNQFIYSIIVSAGGVIF